MASEGAQTSAEYIQHHLKNLQVCKNESGEWVWNHCSGNFWAINVDSMVFSVLLALVLATIFLRVTMTATTGRPGKLQAFIEIVIDFVDGSVKGTGETACSKRIPSLAIASICGVVFRG